MQWIKHDVEVFINVKSIRGVADNVLDNVMKIIKVLDKILEWFIYKHN